MSEIEVHFEVTLLGVTWCFRGLHAIQELVELLEKHCSSKYEQHAYSSQPTTAQSIAPPPPGAMGA